MNRREWILGSILIGSITIYLCWPLVTGLTGWRSDNLEHQVTQTALQLEAAQDELSDVLIKRETIDQVMNSGLHGNPTLAALSYQELVVEFLRQAGVSTPTITTSSPIPVEGLGYRMQFSLQMEATVAQLGSFLDRMESSQLLHRTKLLSVHQAGAQTHSGCSVSVALEVLLLEGAVGVSVDELMAYPVRTDFAAQLAKKHAIGGPMAQEVSFFEFVKLIPRGDESDIETDVDTFDNPHGKVISGRALELDSNELELAHTFEPDEDRSVLQLVGILGSGPHRKAMLLKVATQELMTMDVGAHLDEGQLRDSDQEISIARIEPDCIEVTSGVEHRTIHVGEFM